MKTTGLAKGRSHICSLGGKIHERLRRILALALSASMIACSMPAIPAFAEPINEDDEIQEFTLTSADISIAIRKAMEGDPVDEDDYRFAGAARESYEELFYDSDIYELFPQMEKDKDGSLSLRVFLRLDLDRGLDSVKFTGEEDLIFLLLNNSKDEQTARIYVDDNMTGLIKVAPRKEVVLDETDIAAPDGAEVSDVFVSEDAAVHSDFAAPSGGAGAGGAGGASAGRHKDEEKAEIAADKDKADDDKASVNDGHNSKADDPSSNGSRDDGNGQKSDEKSGKKDDSSDKDDHSDSGKDSGSPEGSDKDSDTGKETGRENNHGNDNESGREAGSHRGEGSGREHNSNSGNESSRELSYSNHRIGVLMAKNGEDDGEEEESEVEEDNEEKENTSSEKEDAVDNRDSVTIDNTAEGKPEADATADADQDYKPNDDENTAEANSDTGAEISIESETGEYITIEAVSDDEDITADTIVTLASVSDATEEETVYKLVEGEVLDPVIVKKKLKTFAGVAYTAKLADILTPAEDQEYYYEDDDVSVSVVISNYMPGDVSLIATEITEETDSEEYDYDDLLEQAEAVIDNDTLTDILFYDIGFYDEDGEPYHVDDPAQVTIEFKDTDSVGKGRVHIIHFADEEDEPVDISEVDRVGDENGNIASLSFETEGFSVFGVAIMPLSEGQGDVLDGDYAYIANYGMKTGDNNGYTITTGTAPWDTTEGAGNDTTEKDMILRTFDTATYSVDLTTAVRDDAPYGTYKTGNLYFELVVEGTADEVQWETGSMGWLESKHGVYTATTEKYSEKSYQVLRGYITLEPSTADGHAIGNTTQELSLALRALAMQNEDTVIPEFTFFMAYNDVGLTDEQYIAWGTSAYDGPIVTFAGSDCETHVEQEYKTITAPTITISASPRYNLALVNSTASKTQQMGSYDFSTGNELALNQDAGTKYGRLGSYGLVLQLVGKNEENGLRGVQIPQQGETLNISFELSFSSTYTSGTTVYETGTTSNGVDLTAYAPLVWSFDENKTGSNNQQDDRIIPTSTKYADQVPYNKLANNTSYNYASCYDGGTWRIEATKDGDGNLTGTYTVTITDCAVDMLQLPWVHPGAGTSLSYRYYNPNNINYDVTDNTKNDYWEVETACISAGELWIVQPYYAAERDDGETYIAKMLGEGTYSLTVKDSALSISGVSQEEGEDPKEYPIFTTDDKQAITTDDSQSQSMALVNDGSIDQHIAYVKYNYSAYNDPLTDGCFSDDKDWILLGDQLAIETYVTNDSAEEGNTGVAYDVMIKFDDAFFEPDGTIKFSGLLNSETRTYLWAVKSDGTGWDHSGKSPDEDGYDTEMKNATPDDLKYYSSLESLNSDGATCVGVLVQYRGLMTEQQNHIHTYVLGKNKTECETDQVYMVTPYCRSWNRDDLAAAMAEDATGEYYGNKSAALSALMGMTLTDVNKVVNNYIPTRTASNSLRYEDGDGTVNIDYPSAHWVNGDSRHPDTATGGSSRTYTILNYRKAAYDENGYAGSGSSGNYWGDSCLVVGYKSGLTIQVAQQTTAGDGTSHAKSVFDMDTGQTVVDYVISPFITRNNGEGTSETTATTEVVVTVELPANLTYISGSSYIGGTYETNGEGVQGTVTDGVQLSEGVETTFTYTVEGVDYTVGVLLTVTEENGRQILTYTFTNVPVTGESPQFLENIYYSCEISSGAVSDGTELEVTADISCSSDAGIAPSSRDDGEATVGITVTKSTAVSLVKKADQTAVEVNGKIGFTMDVGDNSDSAMFMLAVDNIPYNGDESSTFVNADCQVYVTEFSAYDVTATRDLSGFYFFYTTNEEFADKTSADYGDGEYFVLNYGAGIGSGESINPECEADGWVAMQMDSSEHDTAGHTIYSYTNFPANEQVYSVVGIGSIAGQDDINMHVTLTLSDPEPGDTIVNTFTQNHAATMTNENGETEIIYYDLSDNAHVRVVGRTVSGTVWLDEDIDGGIRTGAYKEEQLLAGVDVELQDSSGQRVQNLKTDEYCVTKTDESGYYEFNYVPEGDFRVVFSGNGTPGTGDVVVPTALESYSLADHDVTTYEAPGIDDSLNSKVVRNGNDMITDITMPAVTGISGDTYDVEYQNAGYTKTIPFTVNKVWKDVGGSDITNQKITGSVTVEVTLGGNETSDGESSENEETGDDEADDDGTDEDEDVLRFKFTLNADNEWSEKLEDLPYYDGNGDPVKYTENSTCEIVEIEGGDGYTPTVGEVSAAAEGEGYTVTVTNQAGYELPDTGGSGTLPFRLAGLLLSSSALYLLFITLRRKWRRVED